MSKNKTQLSSKQTLTSIAAILSFLLIVIGSQLFGIDSVQLNNVDEITPIPDVLGESVALESVDEILPVVAVVDGDTFKVQSGDAILTIRLLGIDTPETVAPGKPIECYGPEASDELERLISGQDVLLMTDTVQPNKDRYGRFLRFVYLPDGYDVNAHMLKGGFARHYTKAKTKFDEIYIALEAEAQKNNSGLWRECL